MGAGSHRGRVNCPHRKTEPHFPLLLEEVGMLTFLLDLQRGRDLFVVR